jgi:hypothetical protein
MIRITLSQIHNNKPYYTIKREDGKVDRVFGYEQAEKYIIEARKNGEKVEIEDTLFLDEHNKLVKLVKSKDKSKRK